MLIHTMTEPNYIPGLVPLPCLENINILKNMTLGNKWTSWTRNTGKQEHLENRNTGTSENRNDDDKQDHLERKKPNWLQTKNTGTIQSYLFSHLSLRN